MLEYDVVIIGSGAAGLAVAIEAKKQGIDNILILERENELGGMLNYHANTGFGKKVFGSDLTGTEYIQKFIDKVNEMNITYYLNTTVLDLNKDKIITAVSEQGLFEVKSKSIVLAMGCRERPRGVNMPTNRCAGVYTVGTVQNFINTQGYMPGKEVVILGSTDIALNTAKRMILEGAKVKVVIEPNSYCLGKEINLISCLDFFNIPLKLNYNILDIKGKDRVEGLNIVKVDKNMKQILGSEEYISCDTLLLSSNIVPECSILLNSGINVSNYTLGPEINQCLATNIQGIFACGNIVYTHDSVDDITYEGFRVGKNISKYLKGNNYMFNSSNVKISFKNGIKYTVPSYINMKIETDFISITFKVDNLYINKYISVYFNDFREFYINRERLVPAEIETLHIDKKIFDKYKNLQEIIIQLED